MRNGECGLCTLGYGSKKPPKSICLLSEAIKPADIMIVAEQPTLQDDLYAKVFSGRSLSSISNFFIDAGFTVHTTYAIKCVRPSKEIKPETKQIKVCSLDYLTKEIIKVKPKHIITLGANAYYGVMLKKGGASKPTGNRHFEPKVNAFVYPTVHPMQAAYNQQVKLQLWADLKRFASWIGQGDAVADFEPPVYVVDTLKSLSSLRNKLKLWDGPVAVDTETQGLNPFIPGKHVRSIQFCWDPTVGGVFVPLALEPTCYYTEKDNLAVFWDKEPLEEAVNIIRDILSFLWCDWHNGKFDRLWLYNWGAREFDSPILAPYIHMDTLHVAHDINENRVLKLKQLITTDLGFPTYDIDNKLTQDMDELIPYAARDTVATRLLAQKYEDTIADPELKAIRKRYTHIIRPMDSIFTDIELRGWPVSEDMCVQLLALVDEQLDKAKVSMLEFLEDQHIEADESMLTSPDKLAVLLFDKLEYTPATDKRLAFTKTGKRATDKDAIIHLRHKPFVKLLLEFRKHYKVRSTYVLPMLKSARGRGRLTTSYKLHGTVTARTSSGKETMERRTSSDDEQAMNLQNLSYVVYGPDKLSIRDCIVAREGWKIVEVDFSQIELRIMGEVSKDPLLLHAYQNDLDLHTYRAQRILGITPEEWAKLSPSEQKDKRKRAKAANFGYIYGMEAVPGFKQFALTDYDLELTNQECVETRRGFFDDHAGLPAYYARQERKGVKRGYVESLSGYRRHLPNLRVAVEGSREQRGKYKEAVRMAINTPIQGFASDLKLMSMIEIEKTLDTRYAYLFGEVHDSILAEVRDDKVDYVVKLMLYIMSRPAILDKLGIEFNVPIRAEAKVGTSLGNAKDYAI